MLLETAPIIFFGGKGGVGKTTLATATALRLSRNHRVCLVSTDPAHNLGHIFGTSLGDAPSAPNSAALAAGTTTRFPTTAVAVSAGRTKRFFIESPLRMERDACSGKMAGIRKGF